MTFVAVKKWAVALVPILLLWPGHVEAGRVSGDGGHWIKVVDSPAGSVDALSAPAGQSVVTMTPGQIRTFIENYSFDAQTANSIAAVQAFPQIPAFVMFAFNGGVRNGQTVTIQYRLVVDNDAPGGSYEVRIGYDFLDFSGSPVANAERMFTLVIDAPPPPDDHGDDCAEATPVALGGSAGGEIDPGGDLDFFRVELTEAGTLTAFTTGSTDTVGTLLDDSCTPLTVDQDSGAASNFSISRALDPGVYYVAVGHSSGSGTGAYTLMVEFEVLDPFVNRLYFPQFANGSGLSSEITLLNLAGTTAANALIEILGDDGNPLSLSLNAPTGAGGPSAVAVPADGSIVLGTDGQGNAVSGSVTVSSDQPLAGVVVFGGAFGLAGVGPGEVISGEIAAPVETGPGPGVNTGIALQNLEDAPTMFEAELRSSGGDLLASSEAFSVPARGHRALFVTDFQWDAAVDFEAGLRGVLIIRSLGGDYSAVALLVRPGQLATVPVVAR